MRATAPVVPARRRFAAAVAFVGAVALGSTLFLTTPASATNYPSWDDVVAAKASTDATASKISDIQGLISGLAAEVDAAQAVADQAWAADQAAQNALAEGTRRSDELAAQSAEAATQSEASNKRAAALAAQFARSAGNDLTSHLMVSGSDSDDLLYQLGTMSKLSETSQDVFAKAEQDANTADLLSQQAAVAKSSLESLATAAAASLQSAIDAQKVVQSALIEQQNHEAELTVQLAALQQNSITTEAQYNAGVEAERQRQLAEEKARADAAAAAAAAAEAAEEASGGSGGSDSGSSDSGSGSGSSGGGGGGGGINVSPPAQTYSGEAVVAYAEQFVGVVPYGWGADPSDSFGCDGLTQYVYGQFGISLPRLVSAQARMGVQVSPQNAQAGDLVVWPGAHIGIYDGQGGVIHSPDWGRYVTHATNLWGSYYFVRLV
ncbi:C40 family peptidase [Herbiconiux sp.]|uniref:C40 family peptidase n=1 Tax=Herbiconiux sp. TaxID=1871186 RepID=UPI0025BC7713|nr:C40 family peptidase [Herbiconiux sp.]